MSKTYEEALEKAQRAKDQVVVVLEEREIKLPEKALPKEKPAPKRNRLIEIPYRIDRAFEGKIREEDLEVDDPIHILLKKFRSGEITQEDLSVDDRFVMIRHMKDEENKSPDEIAEELGVTRRTVVNYYKKIKKIKAQALADEDIWQIGGEIYSQGIRAMEVAIKNGKVKDWAYVLTSMVATLQSLGLVFKMPKQSMVSQQIMHNVSAKQGQEGFKQLKTIADNEEINLDSVFNELMGAVKKGVLDKKDVDKT